MFLRRPLMPLKIVISHGDIYGFSVALRVIEWY